MRPLGVAVQRREASNGRMQPVDVVGSRYIMNVVKRLNPFNFDLAETLIHPIHVVGGCNAHGGGRGLRGQAVAQRVHTRTRLALLTERAAAFCAIALVCGDLPLRCHGPHFPDADNAAASWAAIAFSVATRSARALAFEVLSRSSRNRLRRFCADTMRRSMVANA